METSKHEMISCGRCGARMECKANSYTKCQCSEVQLTLNETEYISDCYDDCLCVQCLAMLKTEYNAQLNVGADASN